MPAELHPAPARNKACFKGNGQMLQIINLPMILILTYGGGLPGS